MKKVLLCCLMMAPSLLFAGGFQINTQGQKATAMGGSVTGLALDASAAFFNPAALTKFDHSLFDVGLNAIIPAGTYLGSYGKSEYMNSKVYTPFSVYGAYKWKHQLTFGLSINTPFGLGSSWSQNWSGRYLAQDTRLSSVYFQPCVAYKINDHFSIGGGPVAAMGRAKLTRALPVESTSGEAQIQLDGKGAGFGYNISALAEYGKFSLGLSYRSSLKIDINNGTATFNNVPASLIANGTFPENTSFKTGITLPFVASAGLGYRPSEKWALNLDFNYTGWDVYKSFDVEFPDYPSLNSYSARNYKNVIAVRLGAQYKFSNKIFIRGGLAIDQSPVRDGYVAPELPDNNRTILSTGLSYQYKQRLSFDFSLMYESVRERKESGNMIGNFNGTYKSNLTIAGIGVHYDF